jgi:hypothetical protein
MQFADVACTLKTQTAMISTLHNHFSYAKTETLKILKQHKAYMAQFEELLNDEKIA